MKELKVLAVVVFFTLVVYWGVEPFAYSKMHADVPGNGFVYDGKADIEEAAKKIEEAKKIEDPATKAKVLNAAIKKLDEKKAFWADVKTISQIPGDSASGQVLYSTLCVACHNGSGVNMGGVIPPALDYAGTLYDKEYLIALLKDPAMASNVDHKYQDTMMHPMGVIKTMLTTPQQIADVVAYLKSQKANSNLTPKQAFDEACARCHADRYGNVTQIGDIPKFKTDQDKLNYQVKVLDEQDKVKAYMGKLPPDLSIIARARSSHYLETFVENPQSQLLGTSMPRTGLTKDSFEKVYTYLEETGDPSKSAREATGPWVIGFFVLFSILAYLWKKSKWKDL